MKWSTQKTILFQVGILKLCAGEVSCSSENVDNSQINELKNKIAALESQIRQITSGSIHIKSQNVDNTPKYSVNSENKKEEKVLDTQREVKPSYNIKAGSGIKAWPEIVANLKQEGKIMLYTNLMNSTANEINDMTVGISFSKGLTPFGKTILEKSENIAELEKRVSAEFGKPMRIKYIDQTKEIVVQKEESKIESLAQDLDLPFNIIE